MKFLNIAILLTTILILLFPPIFAQTLTKEFCNILPVDNSENFKSISSYLKVRINATYVEENKLNLVNVKKDKNTTIYYFCDYINFSRGSFEIWRESIYDNLIEKTDVTRFYNKPLNCDERYSFIVKGNEIFEEKMDRFMNIGYLDINGNCTYDRTKVKFLDLLGNGINSCNITLKGNGPENGTIIASRNSIANLNGTNQISLKIGYKEGPLDQFCMFYVPSRLEIKVPKTKKFIWKLNFNIIDPAPDLIYEDEENKVLVWKREHSNSIGEEVLNVNFSYSLDWNVLILGFFGMIIALIIEKIFEKNYKHIKHVLDFLDKIITFLGKILDMFIRR